MKVFDSKKTNWKTVMRERERERVRIIRTNSMVNDQLLKLSAATVRSLSAMCFCDARNIKQLQWFKQCLNNALLLWLLYMAIQYSVLKEYIHRIPVTQYKFGIQFINLSINLLKCYKSV